MCQKKALHPRSCAFPSRKGGVRNSSGGMADHSSSVMMQQYNILIDIYSTCNCPGCTGSFVDRLLVAHRAYGCARDGILSEHWYADGAGRSVRENAAEHPATYTPGTTITAPSND
jgi:hypothetical protein